MTTTDLCMCARTKCISKSCKGRPQSVARERFLFANNNNRTTSAPETNVQSNSRNAPNVKVCNQKLGELQR